MQVQNSRRDFLIIELDGNHIRVLFVQLQQDLFPSKAVIRGPNFSESPLAHKIANNRGDCGPPEIGQFVNSNARNRSKSSDNHLDDMLIVLKFSSYLLHDVFFKPVSLSYFITMDYDLANSYNIESMSQASPKRILCKSPRNVNDISTLSLRTRFYNQQP